MFRRSDDQSPAIGNRLALRIAVLGGFAVVLFTYLGMGLLPSADESVHVYTQSSPP